MAKSLRSKWRRKMRNIKRERYGKKELIRLKKMLGLPTDEDTAKDTPNADNVIEFSADVEMKPDEEATPTNLMSAKELRKIRRMVREGSDCEDSDAEKEIEEIVVLTSSRKLRARQREAMAKKQKKEEAAATPGGETVEVAAAAEEEVMEHDRRRVFNSKTFKDQYGNYPIWMNQKKIRNLAKANRKIKKKEKKRLQRTKRREDNVERAEQSEDSELEIDGEDEGKEETTNGDSADTTLNSTMDTEMQPETIEIN